MVAAPILAVVDPAMAAARIVVDMWNGVDDLGGGRWYYGGGGFAAGAFTLGGATTTEDASGLVRTSALESVFPLDTATILTAPVDTTTDMATGFRLPATPTAITVTDEKCDRPFLNRIVLTAAQRR